MKKWILLGRLVGFDLLPVDSPVTDVPVLSLTDASMSHLLSMPPTYYSASNTGTFGI